MVATSKNFNSKYEIKISIQEFLIYVGAFPQHGLHQISFLFFFCLEYKIFACFTKETNSF
jgi:hypothetical protein